MIDKIKNKHILIDGDIIKYRCAAAAERTKYIVAKFDEGYQFWEYCLDARDAKKVAEELNKDIHAQAQVYSRKEIQPVEFAIEACKTTVNSLLAKLSPSSISIFLSPTKTFRDALAVTAPYKGNRTQPKPKYLKQVEEYLVNEYHAIYGDNVEADDLIGTALSRDPTGSVSISIDKDLLQIPGWHYNWVNDRIQWISPREGDFNFYTQLLTGDATDNIRGLDGYGMVTAGKAVLGAKSRAALAAQVWSCYRSVFGDPELARRRYLENASLLWILREGSGGKGYQIPAGFSFD